MSNTEELTLWQNIGNARIFIQYLVLLLIMIGIHIMLNNSYGEMNESFFSFDTSQSFFNSKQIMWIYSILVFVFIVAVREWTRKIDFTGISEEEKREEFKDFMLYVVICLGTFIFSSAYIRKKFSIGGGMMGGGVFEDFFSSLGNTSFGTLALYSGILIIIVNVISNIYQFLKNKPQNLKDKMLRAIYYAQIATMFIFVISSFFIAGFGTSNLQNATSSGMIIAAIKWIIVIGGSILGIHMINMATDGENWFGDPKGVGSIDTEIEGENIENEEVDEEVDGEVEI